MEGQIITGDCFDILQTLSRESVDLVLTDPPYFISQELKINRNSQGKYKGNDITLDLGQWDHFESVAEYERFTANWVTQCAGILKPGGFFISFFDKRRLSLLYDILEIEQGFKVKDAVTWIKSNPVPQVRKVKFAQATEMAAVLAKPGPNKFRWQNGYHPNYIRLPIVAGRERLKDGFGKTLHTTQKPVMLFRWLIDYFCEKDGWVLDPFAGTCTAAVAALQSGRNAICIEKNTTFAQAGRERIVQTSMFDIDYKSKEYKRKYL